MDSLIYDYETLGQLKDKAPVVNIALLNFNRSRFLEEPYTFQELCSGVKYYKFDIQEQIEVFGKKPEKDTMEWWSKQDKDVRDKQLKPSPEDISIRELPNIFYPMVHEQKNFQVFTRGNSFDPVFTEFLFRDLGLPEPYNWWAIRDTRSLIEGLSWGSGIKNSYIPEGLVDKFEAHNPVHDVAMDVMRIQTLVRAIS